VVEFVEQQAPSLLGHGYSGDKRELVVHAWRCRADSLPYDANINVVGGWSTSLLLFETLEAIVPANLTAGTAGRRFLTILKLGQSRSGVQTFLQSKFSALVAASQFRRESGGAVLCRFKVP
jgi:hypothetical protein